MITTTTNKGNQTMKTSAILLNHEQRGTLAYSMCGNVCYAQGWFYLNGSQVVMRKIGGRNRFMICSEQAVLDFTLHQK